MLVFLNGTDPYKYKDAGNKQCNNEGNFIKENFLHIASQYRTFSNVILSREQVFHLILKVINYV